MGCFSFMCKECGRQIVCDDGQQDDVRLYLLFEGEIKEEMSGKYDSYGRVDDEFGTTVEWETDWENVCDIRGS